LEIKVLRVSKRKRDIYGTIACPSTLVSFRHEITKL